MPDDWTGCYAGGWRDVIVPGAFTHPAKFSYSLVQRMVQHARLQGWIGKGSLVLDPFGGVGCGGIVCAYAGIRWVGVELEPRFVDLAEQNFEFHRRKWQATGDPMPTMIQGDSRQLVQIWQQAEADAVVSSPPYAKTSVATSITGGGQVNRERLQEALRRKATGEKGINLSDGTSLRYGTYSGQLGAMKPGDVDAVLSSPPWENQEPSHSQGSSFVPGGGGRFVDSEYGRSLGQIGNSTGDTFWSAARDIVAACYAVLWPGGHALWVTKDFVRDGARVPFTDDWIRLCEACGFMLVCRHRAALVSERTDDGLFGLVTTRKECKSFFRRLAEKKGSPPIDEEDVTSSYAGNNLRFRLTSRNGGVWYTWT